MTVKILFSPTHFTKEFDYLLKLFGLSTSIQLNALSPVRDAVNSQKTSVAEPLFKDLHGYKLVAKDLATLTAADASTNNIKWLGWNPREYALVDEWLGRLEDLEKFSADLDASFWVFSCS